MTQRAVVPPRNPPLHAAFKAATAETLELLDEYLSAGGESHHAERETWVRQGDVFVQERRAAPLWELVLADLRPTITSRASTQALLAEIARDGVIAPQLNTLIGIGLTQRRIQPLDVLEGLVRHLAGRSLVFDEPEFEVAYRQMEDGFYSAAIQVEAIGPLRGFRSEAPRIVLGHGLEIVELSDEEIGDCLRAGVGLRPGGSVEFPRFGVRARYDSPKFVGQPHAPGAVDAPALAAEDRVEEVVRALAAFKAGRCARASVAHRSTHWFLRAAVRAGPRPPSPPDGRTLVLDRHDAKAFPRFWAALQSDAVQHRASLAVALRRFHDACSRARPEDQLIDLLVAADALALNVAHDSSDPGEMRFRLALRSGFSLAGNRARREFDRHIRIAYQVRDSVVHGSPPKLPATPEGTPQTLEAFIESTEHLLRHALQRAVALAAAPDLVVQDLDWEKAGPDREILSS